MRTRNYLISYSVTLRKIKFIFVLVDFFLKLRKGRWLLLKIKNKWLMSKGSLMSEIIRFIFQIFDELSRKNNIEWKMFFLKNSEIY